MGKLPKGVFAMALVLGAWHTSAAAPRFSLGLATWFSDGRTRESHDASGLSPLLGNPTSVLTYQDLESVTLELTADFRVRPRLVLGARAGTGGIDGGLLVDDDYLSAEGAEQLGATESGAHRWSRTHSSVDKDDLFYLDLELGWSLLRIDPRRSLELFGRYGALQETYIGRGVEQIECTLPFGDPLGCAPEGTSGFQNEDVITNDVDWDSWWLGLRGSRLLGKRFHLSGSFGWAAYAEVTADDTHHLRDDLEQDPSFRIEGEGDGFELALGFDFQISPRVALEAGWRKTELTADTGTLTAFPIDGPPASTRLREIETVRDGVTFGVSIGFGAAVRSKPPAPDAVNPVD